MNRFSTFQIIGKFAISMFAVVVVQGILAYRVSYLAYFDLPLICTVYYGFTLGKPLPSVLMGSTLGLMQDSLSAAVLGTNGFSKTLIGFLAASAGGKFAVDQPITRAFALFLFTLADGLVVTMLNLMVGPASHAIYGGALGRWAISATVNTVFGLVLFRYRDRLSNATT
jgi:rod shape-determining protein MreD